MSYIPDNYYITTYFIKDYTQIINNYIVIYCHNCKYFIENVNLISCKYYEKEKYYIKKLSYKIFDYLLIIYQIL